MRLFRWIFAGILLAGLALPGCSRDEDAPSANGAPRIKVMSFNIARAGARTDVNQIAAAIRAGGADVVGLQAADRDTRRIAEILGWRYADERLNVISRFPLFSTDRDGVGIAFVEVAPGQVVALANVSLPREPYGPDAVRDGASAEQVLQIEAATRMPALAPFATALPRLAAEKVPVFLVGSFNAPSHLDWTRGTSRRNPDIKYPLQWSISKALEEKGFIDSYRAIHGDPVAKPGITWVSGNPHPLLKQSETADRIDFVYAIGPAKAIDSRIVGENAKESDVGLDPWPSDHRAIVSTFEIEPGSAPDLIAVEPSTVAANETFEVRATAGAPGRTIAIFQSGAGEGDAAITAQPLEGAGAATVEFGTARLAPGSYIAAIVDAGGKRLQSARLTVREPAARPRLRVARTGLYPGDPIEVTWRSASEGAAGWIGLYKAGEPNLATYLARVETDGTLQGKATFEAGAFSTSLTPGKYEVRLMQGGGYVELASAPFSIANPNAKPRVAIAVPRVRAGDTLTVSWQDAPGNQKDYIGIYKADEPDLHRYLTYLYTDGAIDGSVTFKSTKQFGDGKPGQYVARLMVNDGYEQLASAPFWIIDPTGKPQIAIADPRVKPGNPIRVLWTSAPAESGIWIGIYKAADLDLQHVLARLETKGVADGEATFQPADFAAALEPGEYQVRLMRGDAAVEFASAQFRVLDPNAGPQVTVAATVKAGEPITVSWKASPGNRTDWIGLYKANSTDTHQYITWLYTEGAIDGSVTFTPQKAQALTPGEYRAMLLVNNGYEAIADAPFTVTAP